jgi:hypothetical protein
MHMRDIPRDILRLIFVCHRNMHMPAEPIGNPWGYGKDINAAPLKLVRVCSEWRDLVVSTPELWNKICVDLRHIDETTQMERDRADGVVRLCLERSSQSSLELCVDGTYFEVKCEQTLRLVEALFAHSQRWRAVHISLSHSLFKPSQDTSYTLQCSWPSELPRLEMLNFKFPLDFGLQPSEAVMTFMRSTSSGSAIMHAPLLSSLRLDQVSFQTQAFSFSQIRKLDIHGFRATYTLEILDCVSQLDFLAIDLHNQARRVTMTLDEMAKREFRRVILPCRSLALEFQDAEADDSEIDETCTLLDQMDLVGLEAFRLGCAMREQPWPPHKLRSCGVVLMAL